jgi:transcriptional regulator with XRE-family HTH domain
MNQSATTIVESVGQRIKRMRLERGWLQCHLADRARITKQGVSRIERDANEMHLFTAAEIARVFGVSLDYLVWGKEHGTHCNP